MSRVVSAASTDDLVEFYQKCGMVILSNPSDVDRSVMGDKFGMMGGRLEHASWVWVVKDLVDYIEPDSHFKLCHLPKLCLERGSSHTAIDKDGVDECRQNAQDQLDRCALDRARDVSCEHAAASHWDKRKRDDIISSSSSSCTIEHPCGPCQQAPYDLHMETPKIWGICPSMNTRYKGYILNKYKKPLSEGVFTSRSVPGDRFTTGLDRIDTLMFDPLAHYPPPTNGSVLEPYEDEYMYLMPMTNLSRTRGRQLSRARRLIFGKFDRNDANNTPTPPSDVRNIGKVLDLDGMAKDMELDKWSALESSVGLCGIPEGFDSMFPNLKPGSLTWTTNDLCAEYGTMHVDANVPNSWLLFPTPDIVLFSPTFNLADVQIPLAMTTARKIVFAHLPGHYINNATDARSKWLSKIAPYSLWLENGQKVNTRMRTGWLIMFATKRLFDKYVLNEASLKLRGTVVFQSLIPDRVEN